VNKIYLLIGILCIAPTLSNAEQHSVPFEVICDDTAVIVQTLKKEYVEVPIVVGKGLGSSQHMISFWGNPETKTFTVIDTYGDTSCILGVGTGVEVIEQSAGPKT